jgi:hypothetical protein
VACGGCVASTGIHLVEDESFGAIYLCGGVVVMMFFLRAREMCAQGHAGAS